MVSISKLQIYSPKDISIRLVNKTVKDDNLLAYIGDDDLVPPSLKSCSYDIFETIGVEQAKTVAFLFRKDKPEEFKDLIRKNSSKVRTFKISANILFAGAHPLEPLKSATEETLKEICDVGVKIR